VLPEIKHLPVIFSDARSMRTAFWEWLRSDPKPDAPDPVYADCPWPVEANFLSACVADDASRAWQGPYPLLDVATLLGATSGDPMVKRSRYLEMPDDWPAGNDHDPRWDAFVSGLAAVRALRIAHGHRTESHAAGRGAPMEGIDPASYRRWKTFAGAR
jgi:hypothetical protein